jgi:hypothetical protein
MTWWYQKPTQLQLAVLIDLLLAGLPKQALAGLF